MAWYWGSLDPKFADQLLKDEDEGKFLVRDSSSDFHIFSMTLKLEGQVHHVRIERSRDGFSFGRSEQISCDNIIQFIENLISTCQSGDFLFFLHRDPIHDGPVRLKLVPLSRFSLRSSLKNLCRFAILPSLVSRERICELPIPDDLKQYLGEPYKASETT